MNVGKLIVVGPSGHLGSGRLKINPNISRIFSGYNISACDTNEELLRVFKQLERVPSTWETIPSCSLYDNVDKNTIVALLTPSDTHYEMAENIAKLGAKVYVEKPLCVNQTELNNLNTEYKNIKEIPLYAADHYYFGNIAGLRLMGINMPFKDVVNINFDNSVDTKFSKCISDAKPFFNLNDIKEIKHIMHESDVTQLVNRSWYYRRGAGGGTLMDLHFHLFNLMNLMGLKMTSVSKSMALKYPYSIDVSILLNRQKSLGELKGTFDRFEQDEAEDAIFVEGIVNYDIPITMQSVRFAPNNTKELLIVGKNNQKIKFLPSSSSQKVQLLSENNKVIAEATTTKFAYDTMLQDIRLKLSDKKTPQDDIFMKDLFNAQLSSLQQIFDIKSTLNQ